MLSRLTRQLLRRNPFFNVRIKAKGKETKKKKTLMKETVIDDKFIKLRTKDEEDTKINQLAKLREQNIKLLPTHDKLLEAGFDDLAREEFEKLKLRTVIDPIEEPLMLYSLVKESILNTKEKRKDRSVDFEYDTDITKLFGKTYKQINKEKTYYNVERQVNETFDIQVGFRICDKGACA